ncbi:hypothetical protein QWY86_19335 [Pedobacter aquatilis]|uniref:hypothetical protein n=1 Tax=Pedobacter aquatilis TaxID=351343 RepID=UPI0025B3A4E6|nr:hypothetical protein [Pedobacter aquatilis]MDN3588844.1 hypothetical protein [Pedobacter aquatilis]
MKNLSNAELLEINGGDNSYNSGISASSSTENLLALKFERSYGSHHNVTEISIGNDINLDSSFYGFGK